LTGALGASEGSTVLETVFAGAVALAATTGQLADAPDRLISTHGVELVNDGRVFLLFAALNGLGYSEESKRKGPPLEAPQFHALRNSTRDAMRPLASDGKLKVIRNLFEDNPAPIEAYLAAILSHDASLEKVGEGAPDWATKLGAAVKGLRGLASDPGVEKLFDAIALEQREHAKALMAAVEKDLADAETSLGVTGLRPPPRLVVVPNPLDSHGAVRRVKTQKYDYLVVGPGTEKAREAILEAALRPKAEAWVEAAWPSAKLLKRHWDGVKISSRISERYPDGPVYLAHTLTRVLSYKVLGKITGASDDEDFVDVSAKDGLRWARATLKALEGRKEEPLDTEMVKLIPKINP
jgi:hypothetical protein